MGKNKLTLRKSTLTPRKSILTVKKSTLTLRKSTQTPGKPHTDVQERDTDVHAKDTDIHAKDSRSGRITPSSPIIQGAGPLQHVRPLKSPRLPRFVQAKELLDAQVANIDVFNGGARLDIKGAAKDKHNAEIKAVTKAVDLCDRAQVYAADKKDMVLWQQLEVSVSDLLRIPDGDTIGTLRTLYNKLNSLAGNLANYAVQASDLEELNDAISTFEQFASKPRDLTVLRKGYNTSVASVLRYIQANFDTMDRLINLWRETDLETDYWNARIIIDLGTRKEKPAGEQL